MLHQCSIIIVMVCVSALRPQQLWPRCRLTLSPLQEAAVALLPISQNQPTAAAVVAAALWRTPFVTHLTDVDVKSYAAASPADGI